MPKILGINPGSGSTIQAAEVASKRVEKLQAQRVQIHRKQLSNFLLKNSGVPLYWSDKGNKLNRKA